MGRGSRSAVYLINRSPSSALEFKIPEELWITHEVDLSNLRRFGCLAYVHSSEGKLFPRAKKCVFTGYPEGVKGYKVWLLDEKKVVISRSVVFREELVYKDIKNQTTYIEDLRTGSLVNDLKSLESESKEPDATIQETMLGSKSVTTESMSESP